MISEFSKNDFPQILSVINDAAMKYKGTIPADCWHTPYMTRKELLTEFDSGVRMFGYTKDGTLIGVMGFQELEHVTLIRHAYTMSSYQRMGIGKSLLEYLFQINNSPRLLLGTWQRALWAIDFYKKNGFFLHSRKSTNELLNTYWSIPTKQIDHSVVLEKMLPVV